MTFLPVGVTVHGVTTMLVGEGARPQSLVTDTLIFLSEKSLTQNNPGTDLHTGIFPGLTIHTLRVHRVHEQPFKTF